MFKVLIADDEMIERNGLKHLIMQSGLEVSVADAPNGAKALEYMKTHPVDILLTDVKMPFMDGIELITEVTKLGMHPKMLIISGFGEFEYAKAALRLGVSNYILKPVDPNEFKKTLLAVAEELNAEEKQKNLVENSIRYLKRYLLLGLLDGDSQEVLQKRAGEGIDLSFLSDYTKGMLLQFEEAFFDTESADYYEEIRQLTDKEILFLNITPQQTLLLFQCDPLVVAWSELAEKIVRLTKNHFHRECIVGVTDNFHSLEDIKVKCDEVEQSMENHFYDRKKSIYYGIERLEQQSDSEIASTCLDNEIIEYIQSDVRLKDAESLHNHFQILCEKYRRSGSFSQIYVKFIFTNILRILSPELMKSNEAKFNEEVDALYRMDSFEQMVTLLNQQIDRTCERFAKESDGGHREVETIKQYIYAHYSENIGINELAEHIGMTASYISHLFKKETGQNLIKFIKAVRMEQAKKMLSRSNAKINDISAKVGYQNVSYFCQSFREYYGISPQKFRIQGESNEMV